MKKGLEGSTRPDHFRQCKGFALISVILVMALLLLVAIAMLSLATVQVKSSRVSDHQHEAEANAKLALNIALGELQRELGPDQRITAPARLGLSTTGTDRNSKWTAVWSTILPNGKPLYQRDDLAGGLRDARNGFRAEEATGLRPQNYLVSGNHSASRVAQGPRIGPDSAFESNGVKVVGEGSSSGLTRDEVIVPTVPLMEEREIVGGYGYWIGDLGMRANLAVLDPYKGAPDQDPKKFLGYLGASSPEAAAIPLIENRESIPETSKIGLLSDQTLDLVHSGGSDWRREHFHDITVHSQGVLTNVREGGLQKNLTVFLNSPNDIQSLTSGKIELSGLSSEDNLVGPANEQIAKSEGLNWDDSRHQKTSPKFGLLRDWARLANDVSLSSNTQEARVPKSEEDYQLPTILEGSSQNLNPAALTDLDQANLVPILVEGSLFNTFSAHPNPAGSRYKYNIRSHDFPRVVLWNPYSVPITLPSTVVMLQTNGRRGFRTDSWSLDESGNEVRGPIYSWLSFGGRTRPEGPVVGSDAYDDAYTGSSYFHLREVTFDPGECLVFLPDKAAEYDGRNVLNNTLSHEADYDYSLNYYHSSSEFDEENPEEIGGMDWYPKKFWYSPSNAHFRHLGHGQLTQSDDSQMILKQVGDQSEIAPPDFDELKQISAVSCSLQYGAGREPPEAWSHDVGDPNSGVDIEFLSLRDPVISLPPDRRTRQGYRLRWFDEHQSNRLVDQNGLADHPEAWDEAFLANWNLRAAYSTRSPFENIIGNQGDGVANGPWFFGIYTKDLYDEAVGWLDQTPVRQSNRNLGNPFGRPIEGPPRHILFDVPRRELGVLSLAQFQHAKISELIWHPSYAIGNSLVDPRLGHEGQVGTAPLIEGEGREKNGFVPEMIGWSEIQERSDARDSWAEFGRGYLHDSPESANLLYDLSFEVNHSLWDNYFLSSGSQSELQKAATSGALPNSRMKPLPGATADDLESFHHSASALMNEGAFNVNSTSINAWKAVLSANRRPDGLTPFPRIVGASDNDWKSSDGASDERLWDATRLLNDDEIAWLAEAIVDEVKARGPFLSLSDFVNRRLTSGDHGRQGALEAAIEKSGVNSQFIVDEDLSLRNDRSLGDYDHPDNIEDSSLIEQSQKPPSKAWGAPAYLTQADLLQAIGSSLTARSDTFVIRTYGESLEKGKVVARAWCEAIVQRLPEPMRPDATGLNPDKESEFPDFGRRFKIKSFRWLAPDEI